MENDDKQIDTAIFVEEIKKRVSVSEEQIEGFLQLWEVQKFKRNELILRAGTIPKFSIFVLKGCVRQFVVNDEGKESIVYFAEERHFIGDLPALRNKVISDFNFQALEPCLLLTLSKENWDRSFNEFSWWAEAFMKGAQRSAIIMQQQLADMQLKSGEERYLDLMNRKPGLLQRVPQHYIASYLGLSPETLSRIRKKLAKG